MIRLTGAQLDEMVNRARRGLLREPTNPSVAKFIQGVHLENEDGTPGRWSYEIFVGLRKVYAADLGLPTWTTTEELDRHGALGFDTVDALYAYCTMICND